jgi:hypothetical protein
MSAGAITMTVRQIDRLKVVQALADGYLKRLPDSDIRT